MIGKTIDHYLVLERLALGDSIYKARDLKLDRLVVLKAIEVPPNDADALASFQKEARAGMSLNHPNIASIFDVIDSEDGRFIIYEHLPGGSLRERLDRVIASGEFIPIERCLDYALDAARGLSEAHRRGIIHRDVSADNIIVTPTHAVKVTNFGKARMGDGPTFSAGMALVSAYGAFSPERMQGQPVDHRSDIFSLCALLFELLTGEKPFRSKNPAALLHEILYNPVPDMSKIRPGIPEGIQKVVEKGMAKKPDERYASMEELIDALREEQREGMREREPLPNEPSLAVLPFIGMGNDENLIAFCDGLTDEVMFQMQSVNGLRVASSTSAARFRGRSEDLRKVGAHLNCNLILEGAARSAGTMVRIILKLTDAETGYQVWTQRFDRDMTNMMAAQDEIAQEVANALRARVQGAPAAVPAAATGGFTGKFSIPAAAPPEPPTRPFDLEEVRQTARGLLAPKDVLPEAIRSARKLLEKQPESADAYVALGYAHAIQDETPAAAEKAFLRATEIDRSRVDAWSGYATHVLAPQGKLEDALAAVAMTDQNSLYGVVASAWILFWSGQYQSAIEQCRRAFKIDANSPEVYLLLGRAFAAIEQYRESIIALGRGRILSTDDPRLVAALGYSYGKSGQADEANRLADELGALAKTRYVSMMDIALPYAGLGLSDWVTSCVDRAPEEQAVARLWWKLDPAWKPFR
jgi:TolB-like protein/Flp pilus assembly protein TadD